MIKRSMEPLNMLYEQMQDVWVNDGQPEKRIHKNLYACRSTKYFLANQSSHWNAQRSRS